MGLSGPEMTMLVASLGSSLLGGITAPQGQKLQSFSGEGDIAPENMLREGKGLVSDYLNTMIDNANQPVNLHTTVNPLPSFKGGGLPMAIAAPGLDPNRINPALQTTQGPQIPKRRLGGISPSEPPAPAAPPPRSAPPEGDDPNNPYDDNTGPGGISPPPSPSDLASGTYAQGDGSDANRALAALRLITGPSSRRTF